MNSSDVEPSEVTKWDPGFTERVMGLIRPIIKGWHRSEVRGLEEFPTGGALVVANHSGGLFAMDVPVFATDFYERRDVVSRWAGFPTAVGAGWITDLG